MCMWFVASQDHPDGDADTSPVHGPADGHQTADLCLWGLRENMAGAGPGDGGEIVVPRGTRGLFNDPKRITVIIA